MCSENPICIQSLVSALLAIRCKKVQRGERADYLRHVDGTDELKWKREGAACIESDTEDQPVDGVMSLKDLTDEQEELERCKHF